MGCGDRDTARSEHSGSSVQRAIPILPVLLIAFGAAALLHIIFGRGVSVFPLAIGIYLIARSNRGAHYPLLVVGAVLAGAGAGNLIGDIVHSGTSDAIGTVGTASGFFWLANSDRGRSNWALIPAAVLGLIAVGQFGFHVSDFVHGGAGSWVVPAGVVVAGILLLGAHRMPGPMRLAGIVFVGAAALSLISNGGDRRPPGVPVSPKPLTTLASTTFELGDRELWFEGVNGPVTFNEGSGSVTGGTVMQDADRVTIEPIKPGSPVTISVPVGARLHIRTVNAAITVTVASAYVDASSTNGVVSLQLQGDPAIEAKTQNGHVTVDDGDEDGVYAHSGTTPGKVTAKCVNCAIILTHAKESVGAGST